MFLWKSKITKKKIYNFSTIESLSNLMKRLVHGNKSLHERLKRQNYQKNGQVNQGNREKKRRLKIPNTN